MADIEQYLNNQNVRKMLDLLAYTEGTQGNGYYTAFGGNRLSGLSDHPRYLKTFRQTDGKTNSTSAAGRYQFLRRTWDGLARQYGLRDFGPRSQDLGAIALLKQNGALPYVLQGNFTQAVARAGGTWASLPTSPHPQPTKSWKKVQAFLGGKIDIPQNGGYQAQTPSPIAKSWAELTGQSSQAKPVAKSWGELTGQGQQQMPKPVAKSWDAMTGGVQSATPSPAAPIAKSWAELTGQSS